MGKNLSNKYDSAKKSIADAIKTASKREIQKKAEATSDLIGNKISDKITSVHSDNEIEVANKRYISLEERQQITDGLRFV